MNMKHDYAVLGGGRIAVAPTGILSCLMTETTQVVTETHGRTPVKACATFDDASEAARMLKATTLGGFERIISIVNSGKNVRKIEENEFRTDEDTINETAQALDEFFEEKKA